MSHNKKEHKQALLIHNGAIGDFIIASELIKFSNKHLFECNWSYLGKSSHGKLARKLGLITDFADFEYPGWHLLFAQDGKIDSQKRLFLQKFDLILNVITASDTIFASNIEKISRAKVFHIDPRVPDNLNEHYFLYLAKQMNIVSQPTLPTAPLCQLNSDAEFANYVLIHPGASSDKKRWDFENFIRLAEGLINEGRNLAFVLGDVELEQFASYQLSRLRNLAKTIEACSLDTLAEIIASCDCYIGNDTGISHLAGALGVKTIVIFVHRNWHAFSPIGPDVKIFPVDDINAESIIDIVMGRKNTRRR